jgi:mannosyltransferase OCH1-like enzyme/GT2 family glycosyltransferase
MTIPKIIHQLWIGNKPAPINLMNTWKDKHPDYEYIYWNESEITKRNMIFECQDKINSIEEINGKADIMRWEILYKYGGIFIDADAICLNSISELVTNIECFAAYENEIVRPGLVATGTMGFPPQHPLVKECINYILNNEVSTKKTGKRAWITVGPMLLTNVYNTGEFPMKIFPWYYFYPIHHTGLKYNGHNKVYAFQEWGSTFQSYDNMNNIQIHKDFLEPTNYVSILIPSYNTKAIYIKECLDSILKQEGYFGMEIVWINDGSDKLHTTLLKNLLENFKKNSRFITVKYLENDINLGLGGSLNKGVIECSYDIILRHDSDDIMLPNRVEKQLNIMLNDNNIHMLGGQVSAFKDNITNIVFNTNHPDISWEEYKKIKSHWIANHPTLCFRKSSIIDVGNYNITRKIIVEDIDLELRVLKKYGKIYNMKDILVLYRLHDKQVTNQNNNEYKIIRDNLINTIIQE